MQSQAIPWDEGVPHGMSVEAYAPEVPGAHASAGMPPSAWTQQVETDGALAGAGAGGEPPAATPAALTPAALTPAALTPAVVPVVVAPSPTGNGMGGPSEARQRATDGLLSRASNEQLLQAAVRATREAAQAAAELRRSLEQHKRRTSS